MTERTPVLVLDFDCTITREHTGGCAAAEAEIDPAYIRGNVKPGFVEFVRTLEARGIPAYIATYGDDRFADGDPGAVAGYELIRRYLDVILGPDRGMFRIPERDSFGDPMGDGDVIARYSEDAKRYHLEWIVGREGVDPARPAEMGRILLVDDDAENLRHFRDRGCSILIPASAARSAALAAHDDLFRILARTFRRPREGSGTPER